MSETKNETMQKLSFENLLAKYHFIVPEIQREYVWGANEHDILKHFFDNIKDEEEGYNIGFLYSYTPNYASDNANTVYLIDGQQRFTTLYLAAFFYAIKEDKTMCFKDHFTYRVRTTTKEFLEKLVMEVKTIEAINTIKDQTWFLSHYKHDPSIQNMIKLLVWLHTLSNTNESMYDKLMKVTFWNFNINQTGQGEELYITMNARGEKVVENEVIRAHILENTETNKKQEIGKKYDEWQDFFWKHRGDNPNADKGFNEFLKWIVRIDKIDINTTGKNKLVDIKTTDSGNLCRLVFKNIEKQLTTLKNLTDYFTNVSNDLKYLPKLNEKNAFSNCLSGDMNNHLYMFVLPILSLYTENVDMKINDDQFKRWMRFFYNIAFNKESFAIQSILQLVKYVKEKHIKDVIELKEFKHDIINPEEVSKLKELSNTTDRSCLEQLFWDFEDHPILQGEVKPFIDHIIEETKSFSNNELVMYKNILFEKCFPIGKRGDDFNLIRRALLTFSETDQNGKHTPNTAYTVDSGRTTGSIDQWRYSFCKNLVEWIRSYKKNRIIYFKLFSKLKEKSLKEIVSSYKNNNNCFYYIIKDDDNAILTYAIDKCFTFDWYNSQIGYILQNTRYRDNGYKPFPFFTIKNSLAKNIKFSYEDKEENLYYYSINLFSKTRVDLYYNDLEFKDFSLWAGLEANTDFLIEHGFTLYNNGVHCSLETDEDVINKLNELSQALSK